MAILKKSAIKTAAAISVSTLLQTGHASESPIPQDSAQSYHQQAAWQEIQQFLPERLQLDLGNLPLERIWEWQGHQVHLDRYLNPSSKVRVILLHGVGTNGRQMSLIVGAPLARHGYETVAIDLPNYGLTQVDSNHPVRYDDWVQLVSDFIDAELQRDPRPIVLYGLSAGGMLAYHAAAKNRKVAGIIGMTFLDQRFQRVRDETARNLLMSRVGIPFAEVAAHTPLAGIKLPMTLVSKMSALVNDPNALKAFLADKTSAGNWASLRFLASYENYVPLLEPSEFDVCPILLTQPAEDHWTPLPLSKLVLDQVHKVPVTIVELEGAGHYPVEDRGLQQLETAIVVFLEGIQPE
ncbi:alpha/beta hydrolase [Aquirhabdus sp.]|uniref:alpha/beta hydrolase n=1 Tax=Aquirhabdus sp. TaxID=2824160 RepID=UPI00396CCC3D